MLDEMKARQPRNKTAPTTIQMIEFAKPGAFANKDVTQKELNGGLPKRGVSYLTCQI